MFFPPNFFLIVLIGYLSFIVFDKILNIEKGIIKKKRKKEAALIPDSVTDIRHLLGKSFPNRF